MSRPTSFGPPDPEFAACLNSIGADAIIMRSPLNFQAQHMVNHTRGWLQELGRQMTGEAMEITLECDSGSSKPEGILRLDPNYRINIAGTFNISIKEMIDMARMAELTYVEGKVTPPIVKPIRHDAETFSNTQLCMISIPAYVLFNTHLKPQTHPGPQGRVHCCSIPGINFDYSQHDIAQFTDPATNDLNAAAEERMYCIWSHILHSMQSAGVEVVCLCAIGCGAFKGNFQNVPYFWGRALRAVLEDGQKSQYSFKHVLVSLPSFEQSAESNFDAFNRAFEGYTGMTSVMLSPVHSMLAVADCLARRYGTRTGVLNPSDAQAIREGYIGMFWDGGHIALEELMAMQTTLLLAHKGINPSLFREDERPAKPVKLAPMPAHRAQVTAPRPEDAQAAPRPHTNPSPEVSVAPYFGAQQNPLAPAAAAATAAASHHPGAAPARNQDVAPRTHDPLPQQPETTCTPPRSNRFHDRFAEEPLEVLSSDVTATRAHVGNSSLSQPGQPQQAPAVGGCFEVGRSRTLEVKSTPRYVDDGPDFTSRSRSYTMGSRVMRTDTYSATEDVNYVPRGARRSVATLAFQDPESERIFNTSIETWMVADRRTQFPTWQCSVRVPKSARQLPPLGHPGTFLGSIALFSGAVTELDADGIVNATNEDCMGGGGVDEAVHKAAGPLLARDCAGYFGCHTGQTRITKGYNLPARCVLHTAGPIGHKEPELISCYRTSLMMAARFRLRTVAFCGISTGVFGYPLPAAAHVAVRETFTFMRQNPGVIERVVFACFRQEEELVYAKELQAYANC